MTVPDTCPTNLSTIARQGTSPSDTLSLEAIRLLSPVRVWFSECVGDAMVLIERRAAAFRGGDFTPSSVQDEVDREKRYHLIDLLVTQSTTLNGTTGRVLLQEIIEGYLREFSRQTTLGVAPLNIANPSRPQPVAKAFWESRPAEHFERQRLPGIHHTALSYQRLLEEYFATRENGEARTGRKAAWDATSELLRASIDTFRARGSEIFPDRELRASIYNDHLYVIEYARRISNATDEKARRAA